MSFLKKLKDTFSNKQDSDYYLSGLSKSRTSFASKLKRLGTGFHKVDEAFLEELMIVLLEADLGIHTAEKIIFAVEQKALAQKVNSMEDINDILFEEMQRLYKQNDALDKDFTYNPNGATVILMVGVNGSGKTTTSAKLAHHFKKEEHKVLLVAADTFRAGAVDQLKRWAERIGVKCISGEANADPASVLVDACRHAKENEYDIVIADTAGRLQNKVNLMRELEKMHKVIAREIERQPSEVWLVIDATTGQNGISQAREFVGATNVSGIILTKLDGSAKGGIVIAIRDLLGLPVRYVGLGEQIEDLRVFDIDTFIYGLYDGENNASSS
ncbi:MAG: signal recognition particle-docking protein FtsY [Breznakia sp.]